MAQFVNKFLKVIGIGGGNEAEEVYEDDYENYGEDGYTEEVDETSYEQPAQTQTSRRGVSAQVSDAGAARVISVNNGMTSSRMVITQPTCYNDVEEVGTYLKSKKICNY